MDGVVKWYSVEKSYGFITGDDGIDYYFRKESLVEPGIARVGDRLSFIPQEGRSGKGMRATQISMISWKKRTQLDHRYPVEKIFHGKWKRPRTAPEERFQQEPLSGGAGVVSAAKSVLSKTSIFILGIGITASILLFIFSGLYLISEYGAVALGVDFLALVILSLVLGYFGIHGTLTSLGTIAVIFFQWWIVCHLDSKDSHVLTVITFIGLLGTIGFAIQMMFLQLVVPIFAAAIKNVIQHE